MKRKSEMKCQACPQYPPVSALRLPHETYVRLDAAKAQLGVSRSKIIRQAVSEYLDRIDADNAPA